MKKSRFKSVLAESLIPTHAEPGEVFHARDTDNVWIATKPLGLLVNLTDLFKGNADAIVREQGLPGKDGAPSTVPGPQGPPGTSVIGPAGPRGATGEARDGKDGRDGRDGRDGVDGQSVVGPQGPKGEPGGYVRVVGPAELQGAVQEILKGMAEDAKFIFQGLKKGYTFDPADGTITGRRKDDPPLKL